MSVTASGQLRPRNQVEIGSEISGVVQEVNVDVNEPVHAGQLLAALDTARLKAQLAQVCGALAVAQARAMQSEASVKEAKAHHARLLRVRDADEFLAQMERATQVLEAKVRAMDNSSWRSRHQVVAILYPTQFGTFDEAKPLAMADQTLRELIRKAEARQR